MRAINVLLSILVSVTLAVLVFEYGLRLFPEFRPQETINEFHPKLGWVKRADAVTNRATRELSITIETNAEGLRDDPLSGGKAKRAGTYRVLALGDSFTLGYTVDREDLFVDLIESWWRSEQRRVQVVNAGTEGYSTDQEVLWFQEYGLAYQPDLVLIFPFQNDIYWNGEKSYMRFPKPRYEADGTLESRTLEDPGPGGVLDRFAMGKFAMLLKEVLFEPDFSKSPYHFKPDGHDKWVFKEFAPLLNTEPAFLADAVERTRGALEALKQSCETAGARLVMVPIPPDTAFYDDEHEEFQSNKKKLAGLDESSWSPERPVDLFLSLGSELGIETLDPREAFRARAEAGERLYFDKEWHFNPAGNEHFASFLVAELDALGVFPDEHAAMSQGAFPDHGDDGIPFWMMLFAGLWVFLGTSYALTYRKEPVWIAFLGVGAMLAVVFAIFMGVGAIMKSLPPAVTPWVFAGLVAIVLGFVVWKLGRRVGTILELMRAFTLRGHWYLMPLVVVLLTIGSLLVVAASSPLIAPFIYTLF